MTRPPHLVIDIPAWVDAVDPARPRSTLWSGVSRLVIGATRGDAMAVGFDEGPVFAESYAYLAERGIDTVWNGAAGPTPSD